MYAPQSLEARKAAALAEQRYEDAAALRDAVAAGVEVLAYGVELSPVELRVGARLPVLL